MPWVLRGRKLYYYRTRRVGRQVIRDYFGSGPEAELAAAIDAARRSAKAAQRQATLAEQARCERADALLSSYCELTELVMKVSLLAAGCHQHARGHWRRRRHDRHVTDGTDQATARASAGG